VAWIFFLPIAHRSVFGTTKPMHQLRSSECGGKPGECFVDVAKGQLSFEIFAWKFLRGIFFDHLSCHPPRKRRIQYAATSRFHHERLGILDRPLSRAMTAACVATANLCLSAWIYLRAFLLRRIYHPRQRNGFAVVAAGCCKAALEQEAYVRSSPVYRRSSFTR
jgi:hypothetical protein